MKSKYFILLFLIILCSCSKKQEQNWVDIENEYYSLLKKSFKEKNCDYKINALNEDFNKVQKLLEVYLKKVEEKFNEDFGKDINSARIRSNIGHKIYPDKFIALIHSGQNVI